MPHAVSKVDEDACVCVVNAQWCKRVKRCFGGLFLMKCKILSKPRTQSIFCCVIIITEKCSKNYGIVKLTSLTTFVDEICTHSNLFKTTKHWKRVTTTFNKVIKRVRTT